MIIAIGSDHAGFSLKEVLKKHLEEKGYQVNDKGTHDTNSCHYPVYAKAVCQSVLSGESEMGILVCGTGIGISISANKVHGIRAALCGDCFSSEMTRRHNDANILALGERVTGPGLALKICDIFLDTPFDGGRHARRVEKMMAIEGRG